MKLTLNKDFDITMVSKQHSILIQTSLLLEGREGALDTEKELYLILAIVDSMIEENLIEQCNNSDKDLLTLLETEIEPFFRTLLGEQIPREIYMELKFMVLNRCREIWDNQHSLFGVIDALLTSISMMDEEDKKEVLLQTAKIAETAVNRKTEAIEKSTEQVNAKIANLMEKYQVKVENINNNAQ